MDEQKILITKANGEKEEFDLTKLEHSLRKAHASPELINAVSAHVIKELEDGMTTHEIYKRAFDMLHKLEKPVAVRYSLRRSLLDFGPSGFPFEKFIAEIFKSRGYKTLTDQIVRGHCVDHEMDVVAWKLAPGKDELVMSEVKFHNQLGMKSDLKVVLYVKSRFDDLLKASHTYDGHAFKLTDGQIVTNTKFTVSAIKYAECQGIRIIGWNYPVKGNLQDLIEEAELHPITSLHTLSERDKKTLIEKGVILCKMLGDKPELLSSLGLAEANIEAVREEIEAVSLSRRVHN